ncbi:hypothetical protein [Desulfoscipio gibsoniae]|uniref:Uncharacterized protein n=1 Tax=Desulfoscipio gibsoniae DSM 7213 TaxID=767817 RepID=R4KAR9_9FIRM|nr:hypothetical protein [Desulfoscipio gibsoniae]AGK99658.1 hypothetical protein Desgi_0038 [Desulfoscipio gibsoniae DSM 7213]
MPTQRTSVGELSSTTEKGKTRDKIAEQIDFPLSGRTLSKGMKIYEAAKDSNKDAQESLKKIDNKESSITAEYKKLFKKDEIPKWAIKYSDYHMPTT